MKNNAGLATISGLEDKLEGEYRNIEVARQLNASASEQLLYHSRISDIRGKIAAARALRRCFK
jgi:hypothetical protein